MFLQRFFLKKRFNKRKHDLDRNKRIVHTLTFPYWTFNWSSVNVESSDVWLDNETGLFELSERRRLFGGDDIKFELFSAFKKFPVDNDEPSEWIEVVLG